MEDTGAAAEAAAFPDELPGIDLEDGLGRVGGNLNLYRKILLGLHTGFADAGTEMGRLLTNGELEEVGRVAHSLKGVAGNVGAKNLQAAAGEVEGAIREGPGERLLVGAENIDMDVLEGLFDEVASIDPGLAAGLKEMGEYFDFDRLSDLLG